MSNRKEKVLLVGDNPFHGISHLSQERARIRGHDITSSTFAADLVMTALENEADGFMFSVSEATLSILEEISEKERDRPVSLYALTPYAYEYVRLAIQRGGMVGLGKRFVKQLGFSGNWKAIAMGLEAVIRMDPAIFLKTYLNYEVSRIESSISKPLNLRSLLLHEIITDMALALDLDWLVKSYLDYTSNSGIQPGFETRNFSYLVDKFREWGIDFHNITIAAPFNKAGFQMNPSKRACEEALEELSGSNVIAMSILAAGYLNISEAIRYVKKMQKLSGVVVGVSREKHARETFRLLRDALEAQKAGV